MIISEPLALAADPAERLTIERVRAYVSHLAETNTPQSVAIQVDALYQTARILMPQQDWTWLKAIKARLHAAAPARGRSGPVITSVQLIDLGLKLMDESKPTPGAPIRMADAIRYRDGLMIALLGLSRSCDARTSPPSKSGGTWSGKARPGSLLSLGRRPRRTHLLSTSPSRIY